METGDLNNDGWPDLVFTSPIFQEGAVIVLYGKCR
jgi:hypothetical protein